MTEHIIISNEIILKEHTSYSSNNNSIKYKHNENGLIKEETHFNHLAEEIWKYVYKYENKKY